MLINRSSGILLHPSSLPGPYSSGDFGSSAYQFIGWLKNAGQTYWQILPLGEIGPGNSPYMSSSAFAGNIFMIDIVELADRGWLSSSDLVADANFLAERVDFSLMKTFRTERLRRAAKAFFSSRNKFFISSCNKQLHAEYDVFCQLESAWLDDYALFRTLEEHHSGCIWSHWPKEFADRNPQALQRMAASSADEIGFWKFCQWCFARQWSQLKEYAGQNGVRIIGDVPIFVAYQSADVWAHQELFELDEQGCPTVVAGVPPDYFSETGQLWGNPLYRWDVHEQTGYAWWIARMQHALRFFDLVRIDHFRGFSSYWEVPANATTAINGRWMPGPGEKLFEAFEKALGGLPIIAEDLGIITPEVIALRDRFDLPGMRVLQFAFGEDESNHFLPHNYVTNAVAYTGTHDNDTSVGWWSSVTPKERDFVQNYLSSDGKEIHWDMIRAISASKANTVIFPLQDVLGLSGEHRMNYPGQPLGNWEWRFSWDQINPEQTQTLAKISIDSGRV